MNNENVFSNILEISKPSGDNVAKNTPLKSNSIHADSTKKSVQFDFIVG